MKFLFGKFPIPLRFRKGGLGELQISKTFFQFFTVNSRGLIQTGILDCGRRRDSQQFSPPEMFWAIAQARP